MIKKEVAVFCPLSECRHPLVRKKDVYACTNFDCFHFNEHEGFIIVENKPIIKKEKKCDTVCIVNNIESYVKRPPPQTQWIKKIVVGENPTTIKNCATFVEAVEKLSPNPKVLVIGSSEKGSGTGKLWSSSKIQIHGVDIYSSKYVDVICDAHYLPLEENSYDGVWIQAVLEHVVEPALVVDEIYRVLRPGGAVYAETPFMQQVHEGAYDFTRFTVLGHRYLFKNFGLVQLGGLGGPEVVLAWSIRYFIWSITRSRKISRLVGLLFGLLMRPFSALISKNSLHDASSGVFFLGVKTMDNHITHKELVSLYRGQFK